jgi:hypothetical protein
MSRRRVAIAVAVMMGVIGAGAAMRASVQRLDRLERRLTPVR